MSLSDGLRLTVFSTTEYAVEEDTVVLYADDVVTLLIDNPDALRRLVEAIEELD